MNAEQEAAIREAFANISRANVDELIIAINDGGEKAVEATSELLANVLTSVSTFLHKLG